MARLIPDLDVASISLKPEQDVARALVTGLEQEVVVYHSYPWLRPQRNDRGQELYLREGETDFVILLLEGLLVLEVKGGEIRYDPVGHTWFRVLPSQGWREIKDPFKQASANLYALRNQLVERAFYREGQLPCAFGYAVVFPDCEWRGTPPPGAESSVLFTARDLPYLGRRVRETITRWNRNPQPADLSAGVLRRLREGLSPTFRLVPVLSRLLSEQDEHLVRLTDMQDQILRGLADHHRALVSGPAGSGKTMLALAHARRQAAGGSQVLFLCFNRGLAEWLRGSVPADEQQRLTIRHFAGLTVELCRQARIRFQPPDGEEAARDFWRFTVVQLLEQAASKLGRHFDAIVVDEAQDFNPDWWLYIELLNARAEEGPLYVFYDPDQVVREEVDQLAFPDAVHYRLPWNCRNTREITQTCGRVLGKEIQAWPDAPAGQPPVVIIQATAVQRRQAVERQVREWLHAGLGPEQIAILSPYRAANSSLVGLDRIAPWPLLSDLDAWPRKEGILFATVRSFKGLEADALLLVDVSADTPAFTKADCYVACSRAKHLLCLVARESLPW